MPTPYGTRGGMAFGAGELRVLRRALALALHPSSASAQDVQECHHLAERVDEAVREGARQREFLLADLARYRAALPGTVTGYLTLLREALDAGHRPGPGDLAALRALRGNPAASALLDRCRAGLVALPRVPGAAAVPSPARPAEERRRVLTALPGGRAAGPGEREPEEPDEPDEGEPEQPGREPSAPGERPAPNRPVPTPAEVFPPKRRPAPPSNPPGQRVAV
ncbi:hypothetical protein [Streptomyces sp. NPDC050560]|uniref:hypothetical protein n=1 Tax=Streptomyces sp. NPDC050560 TaxID=3365630 RepID=UPI0037905260